VVKNDKWINEMSTRTGMIDPFECKLVREGVISYGPSSYGYDFRISDMFRVPEFSSGIIIDPKNMDDMPMRDVRAEEFDIAPNSFVLARSFEYFRIPRDVLALVFGKSTYARCGVLVNVTPLEPEWEGYITICIANTAPCPVRIHANEGTAQVIFIAAADVCDVSYADRKGKYQAQKNIQTATI
jgi:dCTP deaminase